MKTLMIINLSQIVILFLLLISSPSMAQSWGKGQAIGKELCASSGSQFEFFKPKSKLLQYWLGPNSIDHVLHCDKDQYFYHLKNVSQQGKGFIVKNRFKPSSSEALFTPKPELLNLGTIMIFDDTDGGTSSPDDQTEAILFLDPSMVSEKCENGKEILYQEFHKNVFSAVKRTDICAPFDPKQLLGYKSLPYSADILDYNFEKQTKSIDAILYFQTWGHQEALHVLRFSTTTLQFELKASIIGGNLFPYDCYGKEFYTARLLPGNKKLIAFHEDPKMSIVDYTKPSQISISEIYNGNDPNHLETGLCVIPVYDTLRDEIKIDTKQRSVHYLNQNEVENEWVLSKYRY